MHCLPCEAGWCRQDCPEFPEWCAGLFYSPAVAVWLVTSGGADLPLLQAAFSPAALGAAARLLDARYRADLVAYALLSGLVEIDSQVLCRRFGTARAFALNICGGVLAPHFRHHRQRRQS